MLSLFRTNQILGSFAFLVYLFVLRGITFLFPNQMDAAPEGMGILSKSLLGFLEQYPTWIEHVASLLLLFLHAIYITYFLRKHRVVSDAILMPGALYVLVACAIPPFLHLTPILLANTFLLIAVEQMIGTYRNALCSGRIFNVGFWIAVASLFYFSHIAFLLLAIFGLSSLRSFRVSEFLTLLSGAIVVYFLVFTYAFWNGEWMEFWQIHVLDNIAFLDFKRENQIDTWVELGIMGTLLLMVLATYATIIRRQNIQFQKRIGVLYILAVISIFTLFFQVNISTAHLGILTVPVGILLGLLLKNIKPTSAEFIHLLLLIAVLVWQVHPFWLEQ